MDYEKLGEKGGMCPDGCIRCCTYGQDISWRSDLFKETIKKLEKKGKDIRVFFTPVEWDALQNDLGKYDHVSIDKKYCVFADKEGVYGRKGCLIHEMKRPLVCKQYNGSNGLKCELYERTIKLAQEGILNPILMGQLPIQRYIKLIETLEKNPDQFKQHPILTLGDVGIFILQKSQKLVP